MPLVEMPNALKFFRGHTNSFDNNGTKRPDKKSLGSFSTALRPSLDHRSSSNSSIRSNGSDDASNPLSKYKRGAVARGAQTKGPLSRSIPPPKAAELNIVIESPPAVFVGPAATSSGALVSGQFRLTVLEDKMVIKAMELKLVISVRQRKPFHQHCVDCAHEDKELKSWPFLTAEKEFAKGVHNIPFSILLEGHLPITMHGHLSVIDYVFKGKVTPATHAPFFIQQDLNVRRAIIPPNFPDHLPKESIRIFPPTNLTAHAQLPPVIHPIGNNVCAFRLDGVIAQNTSTKTQSHWKIKRINWRLEETQKVISPACEKHGPKPGPDGRVEKKGIAHTETRLLNSEELKSGWKCDYTAGVSGCIEMMFDFSIRGDITDPLCDVKAEDGTEVSHSLIVEMIVAEEFAPVKKPLNGTPTGSARVLRMHFNQVVTERAGMQVSWDEEQPPLYEDIDGAPPTDEYAAQELLDPLSHTTTRRSSAAVEFSPRMGERTPAFGAVEDYAGPPIPEYEELDSMSGVAAEPTAPNPEVGSIVGSYSEPIDDIHRELSSRNLLDLGSYHGNSERRVPSVLNMGSYHNTERHFPSVTNMSNMNGFASRYANRPVASPATYNSGRSLFSLGAPEEEDGENDKDSETGEDEHNNE